MLFIIGDKKKPYELLPFVTEIDKQSSAVKQVNPFRNKIKKG